MRLTIVLRKSLLCCSNHPHISTELILENLHHALHIENQLYIGSHILSYLIQDKDYLILSRFFLDQLIKTLETFLLVQGAIHLDVLEAGAIREIGRQESWRKTCRNHIRSQVVALFHFPVLVLLLLHDAAEFLIFSLAVKHIYEAHHLLVGTLGDVQLFQSLIIYYITDR